MALYDFWDGGREIKDASARVLNSVGACVAWYNLDEFGDACDVIENDDRVELYDEHESWLRTLTGEEFKELFAR